MITSLGYLGVVWLVGSCAVREATGPLSQQMYDNVINATTNMTSTMMPVIANNVTIATEASVDDIVRIQNCSLAEGGVCKFGLLHDYQVRLNISGAFVRTSSAHGLPVHVTG